VRVDTNVRVDTEDSLPPEGMCYIRRGDTPSQYKDVMTDPVSNTAEICASGLSGRTDVGDAALAERGHEVIT
jgi:hypothetical protein